MLDDISIAKLCACIEQEVDVNRYEFQGVHAWPAFRIFLFYLMYGKYKEEFEEQDGYRLLRASIQQHFTRLMQAAGLPKPDRPAEDFRAAPGPSAAPAPEQAGRKILIFCNPDDYAAEPSGSYGSVMMEPWVERLRARHSVLHLEFLGSAGLAKLPRRYPTAFLPAIGDADLVQAGQTLNEHDVRAISELSDKVNDYVGRAYKLNFRELSRHMLQNFIHFTAAKRTFDQFLDMHKPDTVFLICYYYSIALGLLWSCRQRGITTVEVQHGQNGDYHAPYSQWTVTPRDGYTLWPDIFLTWGGQSANNVARWLTHATPHHRVIIGGHPAKPAAAEPFSPALAALAARYRKRVLVTLQPFSAATGVSPFLLKAMQAAPADWLWLIRCHPMAETDGVRSRFPPDVYQSFIPGGIKELLERHGIANAEVDMASTRPLQEVLHHTDHHVTNHSSTVLEALAKGVPTVFIHPLAEYFFESLLARRQAACANDVPSLLNTIERGWEGLSQPEPDDIAAWDPTWKDEFIESILQEHR
ncbi:hypothetical protein E6C67_03595 (plasmid) [Azospirillum sp. TSA2s]|uniref:hypothetical protein n=1 Tax=Azospirillum sp. TSA2s TaxID=709810 RepID=UPI0010AA3A06|nr:hypothetical protein [Azospirillum sp. TSA2s]QCG93041.1 hypothetical protein E6C67_03595 [Azospirillum sp. TSA2s]